MYSFESIDTVQIKNRGAMDSSDTWEERMSERANVRIAQQCKNKAGPEWVYDVYHYCVSCRNGEVKPHAPGCELAELLALKTSDELIKVKAWDALYDMTFDEWRKVTEKLEDDHPMVVRRKIMDHLLEKFTAE